MSMNKSAEDKSLVSKYNKTRAKWWNDYGYIDEALVHKISSYLFSLYGGM